MNYHSNRINIPENYVPRPKPETHSRFQILIFTLSLCSSILSFITEDSVYETNLMVTAISTLVAFTTALQLCVKICGLTTVVRKNVKTTSLKIINSICIVISCLITGTFCVIQHIDRDSNLIICGVLLIIISILHLFYIKTIHFYIDRHDEESTLSSEEIE